jgi:Flp pilus assembly protein TadD
VAGFNLATLGEFEEAVAHGTEAVALAETPGFVARTQSLLVLLWGLGAAYLIHGEAARAVPLLERGRTVALERDVAIVFGLHCSALGYARALQGRHSEAVALIKEASSSGTPSAVAQTAPGTCVSSPRRTS